MAPKAVADVDSIKCPAEAPPENETLYLKNVNGFEHVIIVFHSKISNKI